MKEKGISCFLILGMIVMLTGCGAAKRSPITEKSFINSMSMHNFIINDMSDHFQEEEISAAQIASQEDGDYQIEFQKYPTITQAVHFFESVTEALTIRENVNKEDLIYTEGNYAEYTLKQDGVYYFVARIDNTILYVVAYEEYMEEINTYMKELGYFY